MRLVTAALVLCALPAAGCDACGNRSKLDARPAVAPPVEAAAPRPPVTASFARRAPRVGDRFDERADMHMHLDIGIEASGAERRTEQVLAVAGDAVTRLRVTFVEKSESVTEAGKEKRHKSALAGKSYVVDATSGKVVVSDDKGKLVAPAEAHEVEQRYLTLGKPDPILAAMPPTPLASGEPLPALGKAMEQEMASIADGAVLTDARATLAEVLDDVGVFDVSFKLTRDEGPLRVAVTMTGQLKIARATGWPVALDVKGPLAASAHRDDGDGGRQKLEGRGEMGLSMSMRHE